MFNIGLESLQQHAYIGPGDESSTYEFLDIMDDLERYTDAMYNLATIRVSLQTYGKTPQLVDLVGKSFEEYGVTFSTEGIIESIKKFFVWIKEKIVAMWKGFWKIFGFYKDEDKKKDAAIAKTKEAVEETPDKQVIIKTDFKQLNTIVSETLRLSDLIIRELAPLLNNRPSLMTASQADLDTSKYDELSQEASKIINSIKAATNADNVQEVNAKQAIGTSEQFQPRAKELTGALDKLNPILVAANKEVDRLGQIINSPGFSEGGKYAEHANSFKQSLEKLKIVIKLINGAITVIVKCKDVIKKESDRIIAQIIG